MRGMVLILLLSLFTVFASAQSASVPCDPKADDAWEWIYHFPQESQKGQILLVVPESLTASDNVRPGYEQYMEPVILSLASSKLLNKQARQFTVYRNKCDGRLSVNLGEANETPDSPELFAGTSNVTAQVLDQPTNQPTTFRPKKTSLWKQIAGMTLSVVPYGMTFVNPLAVFPSMMASGYVRGFLLGSGNEIGNPAGVTRISDGSVKKLGIGDSWADAYEN